jgi:hypothetical protein
MATKRRQQDDGFSPGLPRALWRVMVRATFDPVDEETGQNIRRTTAEERAFRKQLVLEAAATLTHAPAKASTARSRELRQRIQAAIPGAEKAAEIDAQKRGRKHALRKDVILRIVGQLGCSRRIVEDVLGPSGRKRRES